VSSSSTARPSTVADARAVGLDGEHHAALHEDPVEDHAAGAAVAGVSQPMWVPVSVEVVADEMDEQAPRLHLALVGGAVHLDGDEEGCLDRHLDLA